MASTDDAELGKQHAEMRRYVTTVVDALRSVGATPSERWDEARASALYWVEGECALAGGPWTHGTVVFCRMTDGWHCAPLNAHGDAERDGDRPLPLDPAVAPTVLAEFVVRLLRSGVTDQAGHDAQKGECGPGTSDGFSS